MLHKNILILPFIFMMFIESNTSVYSQINKNKKITITDTQSSKLATNFEAAIDWPDKVSPGKAEASLTTGQFKLSNRLIEASWSIKNKQLHLLKFINIQTKESINFDGLSEFAFETKSKRKIEAADFIVTESPKIVSLPIDLKSSRIADHLSGKAIQLTLLHAASGVLINWQAELRDGSNYIRQIYTISCPNQPKADIVTRIVMLRLPTPYDINNSIGTVPGSPYIIPKTSFLAGIEQPGYIAKSDSINSRVTELSMPTQLSLGNEDQYTINTMMGYFPMKQRRRAFMYYLERERISKSRTYLHYNSWYDINELSEKKLSKVANSYNEELVQKRGVKMDGFVLDDGWDDPNTDLWVPDKSKFTNGFSGLQKLLQSTSGAKLGLWISPCGGYGGQAERLALVKKAGALPMDAKTFDLGYPGYYKLFKDLCLKLMKKYDVNYFKWDNAAPFENNGLTFGNLMSTAHFMRLCQISAELHKVNPNLFINTTVGTWPSPFWLNHVDCTWRMGGADVSWTGKGDNREKGMNYRDGEVYKMVVKRAPLYPLNSMMFHGVVLGHCYQAKKTSEAGNNMTNEFRSYFALGTNLQELYLSPDLMNTKSWDDLAECIHWNKKHSITLVDSHWVQGDPKKSEPYCYASWRRNVGVICYRNPDDMPKDITIDIESAFELPQGANRNYQLVAAYSDQRIKKLKVTAGIPFTIKLNPFEVLVFDANPN